MGEIGDKLFYRISEAASLTSTKPSVLRYWETEFPSLRPQKSGTGQRLYSRKDIDLIMEIRRLLYEEKMTIAGTKKKLARRKKEVTEQQAVPEPDTLLAEIRQELLDLKQLLQS